MRRALTIVFFATLGIALVYLLAVAAYLFDLRPISVPSENVMKFFGTIFRVRATAFGGAVEWYWTTICDLSSKCRYEGFPGNYTFFVRVQLSQDRSIRLLQR